MSQKSQKLHQNGSKKPAKPTFASEDSKPSAFYMPMVKQVRKGLWVQALPLDDEDPNSDWMKYLKAVQAEAEEVDKQIEMQKISILDPGSGFEAEITGSDHSGADFDLEMSGFAGYCKPMKYKNEVTKGTGMRDWDPEWRESTLKWYYEQQEQLLKQREELKGYKPGTLFIYDENIKKIIEHPEPEEGSIIENTGKFRYPSPDDVARCSEPFLHSWIRNLLDEYEEELLEKKEIPMELHLWIVHFLIMIEKPLLDDLAADLNDLLKLYETISDHINSNKMEDKTEPTFYDTIMLIISEHFQQRFQY